MSSYDNYSYYTHPGKKILDAIQTGELKRIGEDLTPKGIEALADYATRYNVTLPKGYERYQQQPEVEQPSGFLNTVKNTVSGAMSNLDKMAQRNINAPRDITIGMTESDMLNPKTTRAKGVSQSVLDSQPMIHKDSATLSNSFGVGFQDAMAGKPPDSKPSKTLQQAMNDKFNPNKIAGNIQEKITKQDPVKFGNPAFMGEGGIPEQVTEEMNLPPKIDLSQYGNSSDAFKNAAMMYNAESETKSLIMSNLKYGQLQTQYAREAFKLMEGQDNEYSKAKQELEAFASNHPEVFDDSEYNIFQQMAGSTAQMFPFSWETMKGGLKTGMQGAMAAGGAAGLSGALIPGPIDEMITVPKAAQMGFQAGSVLGSAMESFQLEAGFSFGDLIDQGVDPEIARDISVWVGLANAGIEVAQVGIIVKKLPIIGKVLSKGISDVGEEVAQKYIRESTGKVIFKGLKEFGKDVASESLQEVAQETTNIVGETVAQKRMGNEKYTPFTKENKDRLVQTAVQTLKAMPFMVGPGNIYQTTTTLGKNIQIKKADASISKSISDIMILNATDMFSNQDKIEATQMMLDELNNMMGTTDIQDLYDSAKVGIEMLKVSQLTNFMQEMQSVLQSGDIANVTDSVIEIQERAADLIKDIKAQEGNKYNEFIEVYERYNTALDELVTENKKMDTAERIELKNKMEEANTEIAKDTIEFAEKADELIEQVNKEEAKEAERAEGWIDTKPYGPVKVVDASDPSIVKLQTKAGGIIQLGKKAFEKMTGLKADDVVANNTQQEVSQQDSFIQKLQSNGKKVKVFEYNKHGDKISQQGQDYASYEIEIGGRKYIVQLEKAGPNHLGNFISLRIADSDFWRNGSRLENSFKNMDEAVNYINIAVESLANVENIKSDIFQDVKLYSDWIKGEEITPEIYLSDYIARNRKELENLIYYDSTIDSEDFYNEVLPYVKSEFKKLGLDTDSKIETPQSETTSVGNKTQDVETTSKNIGYHAGDLGKAEHLQNQLGSNRGTGHFGTGTYFVGDKSKISNDTYGKRPQHEIDLSDYNLYTPKNTPEARILHDDILKFINRDYLGLNEQRITEEALERVSYGEHDSRIQAMKDLGLWDEEEFQAWFNQSSDDYIASKSESAEIFNYIKDISDKAKSRMEYQQNVVDRQERFETSVEKLGLSSVEEAYKILDKIVSDIKEEHDIDLRADKYVSQSVYNKKELAKGDSLSTRFMKALGYDGVDVRHIKEYDDTTHGSVVYDLKSDKKEAEQTETEVDVATDETVSDVVEDIKDEHPEMTEKEIEDGIEAAKELIRFSDGKTNSLTANQSENVIRDKIEKNTLELTDLVIPSGTYSGYTKAMKEFIAKHLLEDTSDNEFVVLRIPKDGTLTIKNTHEAKARILKELGIMHRTANVSSIVKKFVPNAAGTHRMITGEAHNGYTGVTFDGFTALYLNKKELSEFNQYVDEFAVAQKASKDYEIQKQPMSKDNNPFQLTGEYTIVDKATTSIDDKKNIFLFSGDQHMVVEKKFLERFNSKDLSLYMNSKNYILYAVDSNSEPFGIALGKRINKADALIGATNTYTLSTNQSVSDKSIVLGNESDDSKTDLSVYEKNIGKKWMSADGENVIEGVKNYKKDGIMYVVKSDKHSKDSSYRTLIPVGELEKTLEVDERLYQDKLRSDEKQKIADQKEAEAKAKRDKELERLTEYIKDMTPMKQGAISKNLEREYRYELSDGTKKVMSRREFIEWSVDNNKIGKEFSFNGKAEYGIYDNGNKGPYSKITKTEFDYFNYLNEKKLQAEVDNELGSALSDMSFDEVDNLDAKAEGTETVLYHGSKNTTLTSLKGGTWFSPVKEFAERFALGKSKGKDNRVYSTKIDLSKLNLIDLSSIGMNEVISYDRLVEASGIDENIIRDAFSKDGYLSNFIDSEMFAFRGLFETDGFVDFLKSQGYEGIKAKEGLKSPTDYVDTYSIFSETAIDSKQDSGIMEEKSNYAKLADHILSVLKDRKNVSISDLYLKANDIFGGKMSDGVYDIKDVYDSMELAVNRFILDFDGYEFTNDIDKTKLILEHLETLLQRLPTQTKRTGEMVSLQQFSTPPNIAYVVNWLANINKNDVVLEPSAGTGSLAIWGKKQGAEVVVNEISNRRNEILHQLPFDRYFTENAEQINNILPKDVKPSVVVMNPPFSATIRMDKTNTANAKKHIEQALKRLEPNGRLVVLTGNGMAEGKASFADWWKDIKTKYDVKANIRVDGKNYGKYGTTFDIQLIVIDNTGATVDKTITGEYKSLEEIIDLLGGIRDDRQRSNTQTIGRSKETSVKSDDNGGISQVDKLDNSPDTASDRGDNRRNERVGHNESGKRADGQSDTRPETLGDTAKDNGDTDNSSRDGRRRKNSSDGKGPRVDGQVGVGTDASQSLPGTDGQMGTAERTNRKLGEGQITVENKQERSTRKSKDLGDSVYESYKPAKLKIDGAKEHPTKLAESAAMSAIDPPNVTYTPSLDKKIIKDGVLSLAQLEAVVYAGQAHEQILPNGKRRGHFIGDGTGVGKGREIAGIIVDNFNKGRKKAVWITTSKELINDAKRDLNALGYTGKVLYNIKKGNKIASEEGVYVVTYDTISDSFNQEVVLKDGKYNNAIFKERNRIKQLLDWLGPDFDGVIAFDEAHKMKSAMDIKKSRGVQKASLRGMTGLVIDELLPNARVEYVSATGATELSNLAYAQRLGLWGEGASFVNVEDFIMSMDKGGLSAMEVVARELKGMGAYLSRTLSFEGVTYGRLEHQLSDTQTEVYNQVAESWQIILDNVYEALEVTESDSKAKMNALKEFWAANQRFYNQMLISLKLPSVISDIQRQLKEGNSVVLQMVSTYEAATDRKIANAEDGMSFDDIDLSPRETIINFLEKAFPVQLFEEIVNENGDIIRVPVLDSEGKPVLSEEAIAMRTELIEKLATLPVPEDPMVLLFEALGHENIAEISGRKRRMITVTDEYGNKSRTLEKRGTKASSADIKSFNDGKKRVLVFTKAGNTGVSFHASNDFKNQEKRIHYLLEAGFSADEAIQGFGRTHRSNEVMPPHYVLVTTNIPGEKRFISTIAKRLDQLGALTKGQRQTGSTGIFSSSDNIESVYAKDALQSFFTDLAKDQISDLDKTETFKKLGLENMLDKYGNLKDSHDGLRDISKFLNRVLAISPDMQDKIFGHFEDRVTRNVEKAIANGTFDTGMENIKADSVEVSERQVAKKHEGTNTSTDYVKLKVGHKAEKRMFTDIKQDDRRFLGFYQNTLSKNIRAVVDTGTKRTDSDGRTEQRIKVLGQADFQDTTHALNDFMDKETWQKIDDIATAESLWNEQYESTADMRYSDVHMITGALLPVWKMLPDSGFKIKRTITNDGEQILGRIVSNKELHSTLASLGMKIEEGQATKQETVNIGEKLAEMMEAGVHMMLSFQDWMISKKLVSNEKRFELTGKDVYLYEKALTDMGVFKEIIQYKARYFIPVKKATTVVKKIVDVYGFKGMTTPVSQNRYSKATSLSTVENKVMASKNISDVKSDTETYNKAKTGDIQSAVDIVSKNTNNEQIEALGKSYPKAHIMPIIDMDNMSNAIPKAFAANVANLSGLPLDLGMMKVNSNKNTKMTTYERMSDKPVFEGLVVSGREYVIVDDVFTLGSTISELKKEIESRGGKVVAVVTLAETQNGTDINVTVDTKQRLEEKFGTKKLESTLKERGVINESIDELTEGEAKQLEKLKDIDDIRAKVLERTVGETDGTGTGTSKRENKQTIAYGYAGKKLFHNVLEGLADKKDKKKIKSFNRMISELSHHFKLPVDSAQFRRRKALGYYEVIPKTVRIKYDNNIEVVMHEIGHHLDHKYNMSTSTANDIAIQGMINNLPDAFAAFYETSELPGEAVAEFTKMYIMDPKEAMEFGPSFYPIFEKSLSKQDLNVMQQKQQEMQNFMQSSLDDMFATTMVSYGTNDDIRNIKDKSKYLQMRLQAMLFDDSIGLLNLAKFVEKSTGEKLLPSENPHLINLQTKASKQVASAMIGEIRPGSLTGMINPDYERVYDKTFGEVLGPIADKVDSFSTYIKNKHAIDLVETGHQVYSPEMTIGMMREHIELAEKNNPEFVTVAKDLREWWNVFMEEWVVKTGLISTESWKAMQDLYPNYVPMFRAEMDYTTDANGKAVRIGRKKGAGNQFAPIKRLSHSGSGWDTFNPLESMVMQIYKIVDTQMKRDVMLTLDDMYNKGIEGIGQFYHKINRPMDHHSFDATNIKTSMAIGFINDHLSEKYAIDLTDKEIKTLLFGKDTAKDKIYQELFQDMTEDEFDAFRETINKLEEHINKDLTLSTYNSLVDYLNKQGYTPVNVMENYIDDTIEWFTGQGYSKDENVMTVIDRGNNIKFYKINDKFLHEALAGMTPVQISGVIKYLVKAKSLFTQMVTASNPFFSILSNLPRDIQTGYVQGHVHNPVEYGADLAKQLVSVLSHNETNQLYRTVGGGFGSSMAGVYRNKPREVLNKLGMQKSNPLTKILTGLVQFNEAIETAPRQAEFVKVLEKKLNEDYSNKDALLAALYESRDVTVNFMKKGQIMNNPIAQTIPFLNAGLQGLDKLYRMSQNTDKRAEALVKAIISLTLPTLMLAWHYRDDEDYKKIAKGVRDNYWLIKYAPGKFYRIPKPRELAFIFSTVTDRMFDLVSGKPDPFDKIDSSFINVFAPPIRPVFWPLFEVLMNKSWTGAPIVPMNLQYKPTKYQYDEKTSDVAVFIANLMPDLLGPYTSPKNVDYLIDQLTGVAGDIILPLTTATENPIENLVTRRVTSDVAYSNDTINDFYKIKEELDKASSLYKSQRIKTRNYQPASQAYFKDIYSRINKLWDTIKSIEKSKQYTEEQKVEKIREYRVRIVELAQKALDYHKKVSK